MSTLSDLTNAGDTSTIPGYVLSKPRLVEIGKSESEFARRYLAFVAEGSTGFPLSIQADVAKDAKNDIKLGDFCYGAAVWKVWAMAKSSVPYLTWLCLQVKHGDKVTMEDVAGFYEAGDADAIAAATWQLWGIITEKKSDGGAAAGTTEAAPIGPPSSSTAPPPPQSADLESPQSNSST